MLTRKENIKSDAKVNKTTKNNPETTEAQTTSCCQPSTTSLTAEKKTPKEGTVDKKNPSKTRITIKYDAGYSNQLYIRGKGANLSWEKGQPLKNTQPDEWIWETEAYFSTCEFKILINDRVYENGDNHHLNAGSTVLLTPHFY